MVMYRVVAEDGTWSGNYRRRETAERIAEVWKTTAADVKIVELEVDRW